MTWMKVCLVTIEYPPDAGGVGQSVRRISRMLSQMGCEVHVVVFHTRQIGAGQQRPDAVSEAQPRGLSCSVEEEVRVYRMAAALKTDSNPIAEFLSDIVMEIKGLHEQHQFDLFHAFFLNETGFLATLLANELGVPIVNSVRGSDLHKNIFNSRHFSQTVWALRHSSWVTFVSRDLERRAHALVPSISHRTSAFWNSAEPVDFHRLSQPEPMPDLGGIVIGAFGRFRDKKGIDLLIQACEALAQDVSFTLLLVGDFVEKEKAFWQALIKNSVVADHIVVTGILSRPQALQYYPLVDIFAIPSLRDGCPNTLIEAMMAGRAVVGSRIDAIGEIIEHDVNGLLVRPGSSEKLAEAILKLSSDETLRQRLGSAARQTAMEKLTPEVERNNWLGIYKKILGKTGAVEEGIQFASA